MATNELGLTIPAGSDAFDPAGDMADLANSFRSRIVIPVANTTERDALVAAISWTPSAAEPLRVHREDATVGLRDEFTEDGTTWQVVRADTPRPFKSAGGVTTITTVAATVVTKSITFPAGAGFTQTPIMPAPNVASAAGGLTAATARAIPTSNTAATIYLYSATGTNFTAGIDVPVQWFAVQMLSGAAAG